MLRLAATLAPFGAYQTWAQEAAVADQNAKGGIVVDGVAHRAKLGIYDDKSDGNVAASNVDTLITKDEVVAVLGPIVPSVGNPAALAAERKQVPYLETGNPLEVFRGSDQWKWAFQLLRAVGSMGLNRCSRQSRVSKDRPTEGRPHSRQQPRW
jgi:branched-chain amino acid transport system substrate-binding protein